MRAGRMNTIAAPSSFLPLGDRDDDFRLGRPALWAGLTTDSVLTAFPSLGVSRLPLPRRSGVDVPGRYTSRLIGARALTPSLQAVILGSGRSADRDCLL